MKNVDPHEVELEILVQVEARVLNFSARNESLSTQLRSVRKKEKVFQETLTRKHTIIVPM